MATAISALDHSLVYMAEAILNTGMLASANEFEDHFVFAVEAFEQPQVRLNTAPQLGRVCAPPSMDDNPLNHEHEGGEAREVQGEGRVARGRCCQRSAHHS
jgi:hypothetical protein